MKVSVDSSKCQGHGMCEAVGGAFFTLDDGGYCSIGLHKEVPAGSEEQARLGVESCPESALTISE